ncbi:MAG: FoF1 ATP synthase subunit gamma, partial [Bacteroidota bacterium]
MPSIKEVANRINSVISTQQLTQAMKVVAAAKLNKVQQQVLQMRPYAEKLTAMLDNVTAGSNQQAAQLYQEERPLSEVMTTTNRWERG